MTKYPPDVMVLYAEGYSVSNFLVANSNRGVFLNFVAQGMHGDWDAAVKANYGYGNVEDLEKAWVDSLYKARQQQATQVVSRPAPQVDMDSPVCVVVRQTAPPAAPLLEAPRAIVRGQAPDAEPYAAEPKGADSKWWLPNPPTAPGAVCARLRHDGRLATDGNPSAPPEPGASRSAPCGRTARSAATWAAGFRADGRQSLTGRMAQRAAPASRRVNPGESIPAGVKPAARRCIQ